MVENTIASQIKKYRNSRGWTQSQLADKLSVSKQTISNWETGIKVPRMGSLQKLANLFNVKIGEITNASIKNEVKETKTADLADEDTVFTYEGRQIPPEDLEYMKRILRGGKQCCITKQKKFAITY